MRIGVFRLGLLAAGILAAGDPSAAKLFRQGLQAEKAGRVAEAYLLYSRAALQEPGNRMYWLKSQSVQSRAALQAKVLPSGDAAGAAEMAAPEAPLEPATMAERMQARQPLPPTDVDADPVVKDIDFRGDGRKLFEDVAHAFNLECVFDRDYVAVPAFRLKLEGVNYRDALRSLEATTASFIVPLTSRIFLVAKDTQQKRLELEPQVVVGVHVDSAAAPQDFTAMVTAVQQTFAVERVGWDSQNGMVILKGQISKVLPARALFEDLLRPKAEVVIDLKFVEASRNDVVTYGLRLPTAVPLLPQFSNLANLTLSTATSLVGFTAVQAALVAQMTRGTGRVLLESELRTTDGLAATLHIGDKYPILTAGYFGPQSFQQANQGSQLYTPPPAFNFEDLGLSLKITPNVHGRESVSLDLDAEFKVLTGSSANGIPVIAHREIKSKTRLQFGEWSMLLGLLNPSETRSITGVAGLAHIPTLGALFGVRQHNQTQQEEMILLRPRLVTLPPSEMPAHTIWVGTETRPKSPL